MPAARSWLGFHAGTSALRPLEAATKRVNSLRIAPGLARASNGDVLHLGRFEEAA